MRYKKALKIIEDWLKYDEIQIKFGWRFRVFQRGFIKKLAREILDDL